MKILILELQIASPAEAVGGAQAWEARMSEDATGSPRAHAFPESPLPLAAAVAQPPPLAAAGGERPFPCPSR